MIYCIIGIHLCDYGNNVFVILMQWRLSVFGIKQQVQWLELVDGDNLLRCQKCSETAHRFTISSSKRIHVFGSGLVDAIGVDHCDAVASSHIAINQYQSLTHKLNY